MEREAGMKCSVKRVKELKRRKKYERERGLVHHALIQTGNEIVPADKLKCARVDVVDEARDDWYECTSVAYAKK